MSNLESDRKIRKCCAVLGLEPKYLTKQIIIQAWKDRLIKVPFEHSGLVYEKEVAVMLNTAKDVLLEWIDGDDPGSSAPVSKSPSPSPPRNADSKPLSEYDYQFS